MLHQFCLLHNELHGPCILAPIQNLVYKIGAARMKRLFTLLFRHQDIEHLEFVNSNCLVFKLLMDRQLNRTP